MAENSKIEWTHHTFNPWRGCTKVAAGCEHCYADALSKRNPGTLGVWGPNGTRVMASESYWREPLKWNREAEAAGERRRVFCASLADVFEDWQGRIRTTAERDEETGEPTVAWWTPDMGIVGAGQTHTGPLPPVDRLATMNDLRVRLFALIDATPHLDWLLLTKRPENILRMWPKLAHGEQHHRVECECATCLHRLNVWLLTSIATQADADRNVPELLKCRDLVPVLGLSAEPLLGPVNLRMFVRQYGTIGMVSGEYARLTGAKVGDTMVVGPEGGGIDWVIVGGESGPHARPMHPDWACSLRDQCQSGGVPFFFKQWGEWCGWIGRKLGELKLDRPKLHKVVMPDGQLSDFIEAGEAMARVGKKAAGRLLDGREWNEYPKVEAAV